MHPEAFDQRRNENPQDPCHMLNALAPADDATNLLIVMGSVRTGMNYLRRAADWALYHPSELPYLCP
jgi:hypothetical protein